MKVTAWKNGRHLEVGTYYGLKVSASDRDKYFDPGVKSVTVRLPNGKEIVAKTAKASFWTGTCRELIHREIGRWFIDNGYAPWSNHNPPKFDLSKVGNRYELSDRG